METRRLGQAQTLAVRSPWPPDGTRVKTTRWPALSVKITLVGETTVSVPGWYGLPQPGGGLPDPSLSGWVVTYHRLPTRTYAMPQCV